MSDFELPREFLHDAGVAVVPGLVPAREARAWLADWQGERGVLRARPVPAGAAARDRLLEDVAWVHTFLARLAGQGFPSPRPLPAFSGQSWSAAGGHLWELVSTLHGRCGHPAKSCATTEIPGANKATGTAARLHRQSQRH